MTTFQAIVTAILTVFTEIFPVSAEAHHRALSFFLGWTEPQASLLGTIYAGLFLALLVIFRYDFLSFFSQSLQVILYRRRPSAIDEKLPIFIWISLILPVGAWFLFHEQVDPLHDQPLLLAGILALAGLPMGFLDSYTRKNKNHYDWNWIDALLLGLGSALFLLPGVGRMAGAFTITAMRNFSREGAAKFILYSATPMIGATALWHFSQVEFVKNAPADLGPLTFWITLLVSFLTGLFVVSSFLAQIGRATLWRYSIYRVLLAVAIVVVYFVRGS